MSVGTEALLAQLAAARTRKFSPAEGVEFTYTLPSQFRSSKLVDAMRQLDGDAVAELLLPLLTGWSGVTQATLLGPAVGSSDPAPAIPAVARILLADRPAWLTDWGMHAVTEAAAVSKAIQEQQGN